MNKWKLTTGVLLVFLTGVLAGALGTGLYFRYADFPAGFRHQAPEKRTDFIMGRLSRDLDLTEAQQVEIRRIVGQAEEKIAGLKSRVFPEFKAIIDASFAATREKLNPTQQKKLDDLHEKMQQIRRREKDAGRDSPPM